ncbi:hypothetical protein DB42_BL00440 [Neochlamydia sp. EPS4]|uniref:IS66 family transposase n=1 Tax=Neochlamydia sp. EPS4 TaxID=1478175 RepID=UPI0005833709|nr:hypothetical protein DB42_BL00440 [Neochlamydia sp. EPS4]
MSAVITNAKKLQRFCHKLLKQIKHFHAYLEHPAIPMTHNAAEESLRNLVIVRKLCLGSLPMAKDGGRRCIAIPKLFIDKESLF